MAGVLGRLVGRAHTAALHVLTRHRGVRRVVNGEPFLVDARVRGPFADVYDAGASTLLRARVRPGGRYWNVGANVGVYALQLARLAGAGGWVLAVEPNGTALRFVERNLALNGMTERTSLEAAAVGEAPGRIPFFTSGTSPMGRPGMANPLLGRTDTSEVPVVTLDQLADRYGVPDGVVMDIEGFEIAALLGGDRLLGAGSPLWLIVELHPDAWQWSGHDRSQLDALIERHGLVVTALSGQGDPLADYGQVLLERR